MEIMRSKAVGKKNPDKGRQAGFGYGFAVVQDPVWTLSQVLLATGGRFLAGRTEAVFRCVSTDSRTVEPGDLFVALSGETFNGHDFISAALRKGAAGLVVSQVPERKLPVPVVLVEDTLRALGDLARYRRSRMPDLQVLGITGSSGKTTVKEMAATILAREFNVLKTKGNFNNLIGLPLSLLPVEYHHDFAVLEMGMNMPGEIARLAEVADPDIGCITNIQDAHLAGLETIAGVARAKGELFDGMKAWGKLAVNIDDKRVRGLARRHGQEKITFGRGPKAMVRATHVRSLGEKGMSFTLAIGRQKARVRMSCIGGHNVLNGLAAAALAHGLNIPFTDIVAGLEAYRPFEKRLQVQAVYGRLKLVNDTYNANPASMLAALEAVSNIRRGQKAVAVLGDMLELGDQGSAAHRFVGEKAACLDFDYLLAVGSFAGQIVNAARKAGMAKKQALVFESKEVVVAWLREAVDKGLLVAGDFVLVKGSRGMRMETIAAELSGIQD